MLLHGNRDGIAESLTGEVGFFALEAVRRNEIRMVFHEHHDGIAVAAFDADLAPQVQAALHDLGFEQPGDLSIGAQQVSSALHEYAIRGICNAISDLTP